MAAYRLTMNYPSGKVEEIDELFDTMEETKNYGTQLKGQVVANSRYIDKKASKDPYFIIVKREDGQSSIVFDSRS